MLILNLHEGLKNSTTETKDFHMVENTIIFFKKKHHKKDSSLSFYIKTLQNKRKISTEKQMNGKIGKIHEYTVHTKKHKIVLKCMRNVNSSMYSKEKQIIKQL